MVTTPLKRGSSRLRRLYQEPGWVTMLPLVLVGLSLRARRVRGLRHQEQSA